MEEAKGIKVLAVDFFMGLYNQNSVVYMNTSIPNFFPRIEDANLISLSRGIDLIEVKESLFRIVGLKALGVDGFLACFYQNQ